MSESGYDMTNRLWAKVEDLEQQNERIRKALADHERDRKTLERIEKTFERIETKLDRLMRFTLRLSP